MTTGEGGGRPGACTVSAELGGSSETMFTGACIGGTSGLGDGKIGYTFVDVELATTLGVLMEEGPLDGTQRDTLMTVTHNAPDQTVSFRDCVGVIALSPNSSRSLLPVADGSADCSGIEGVLFGEEPTGGATPVSLTIGVVEFHYE